MDSSRRHIMEPSSYSIKPKWLNFSAIFIIQFLFSQLILSYGIYTVHNIQNNISILDCLWPPLIFLVSSKIFYPWIRELSESYYENHFRQLLLIGILICSFGISLCSLFESLLVQSLFYGAFGGFGSSLTMAVIENYMYDKFPYQVELIRGIQHVAIASGLFITPHIIQFLLDTFPISWVYLLHCAIVLHTLPAALLFDTVKHSVLGQKLTTFHIERSNYTYDGEDYSFSNISQEMRNWKSPSDSPDSEDLDDINEILDETPITPSTPKLTIITGVNILPQILEENEEDLDENNKRNSILNRNLKRMSVISCQLGDYIELNDPIDSSETEKVKSVTDLTKTYKMLDSSYVPSNNFRRRLKYIFGVIFALTIEPIVNAVIVLEFIPCLFTNIHSMLSPLIFFNFISIKLNQKIQDINVEELAFLFSVTAFTYLVFLISLPCISSLSKRYLKYLYIFGCTISILGVQLFRRSKDENFHVVSCLIYGFGFGIESYLKQALVKESLGVENWSKVEGTLEFLSGLLLCVVFLIINGIKLDITILDYRETLLFMIFCSHIIVLCIWILMPVVIYFRNRMVYRPRDSFSLS